MNVFPPLTGRLMYYASPSDQRGWWGAGRWGVSMSDAPWHWLYKWMHLHAFHFPAHRSREELIGPSLIGDDWLQLGPPMHFDGLHIWQSLLTQWLNHARLSAWSLIVRDTNVGSSLRIVLSAAQTPLWSFVSVHLGSAWEKVCLLQLFGRQTCWEKDTYCYSLSVTKTPWFRTAALIRGYWIAYFTADVAMPAIYLKEWNPSISLKEPHHVLFYP